MDAGLSVCAGECEWIVRVSGCVRVSVHMYYVCFCFLGALNIASNIIQINNHAYTSMYIYVYI